MLPRGYTSEWEMSEELEFLREIIDEFLQDATVLTGSVDAALAGLEGGHWAESDLEEGARALHTLRTQAGFLDFDGLAEVALGMERLLDRLRQEERPPEPPVLELLRQGRATMDEAVDRLRAYDTGPVELGDLPARLQAVAAGDGQDGATEAEEEPPEAKIARIGGDPSSAEDLPQYEGSGRETGAQEAQPAETEEVREEDGASLEVKLEEVEVVEGPIGEEAGDFVPDFLTEAGEILDKLDGDLVRLEETGDDLELLNEIFRAAHTLKGTSAFLGFAQMSDLTHKMESVLDLLRKGEMRLGPGVMDVILQGVDQIKILLGDIQANAIARRDLDGLRRRLLIVAQTRGAGLGAARSEQPEMPPPRSAVEPVEGPVDSAGEPAEKPVDSRIEPAAEPVDRVEPTIPAPTAPPAEAPVQPVPRQVDQVIRVDVERIDEIMNLTEELVLGRNRLNQLNGQLLGAHSEDELVNRLSETTSQVGMLTGDLQESVMKMRMVPVGRVFSRFPRMVRDLARDLGKQIELVVEDNDTEIDKSVADEIGDPLVHLIRNAVDHGIEAPEARQQAGKAARGRVLLAATHEGNHIVIRIRDDGAGMDPEQLKQKAIEKGIIDAAGGARMEDGDAYNLIFAPGFSTAGQVSGVSGRGVGMDVVKTNITRLNGSIELDSVLGRGTEITIRLPLTLAIIGGLQVGVGQETFIIPLTAVVEALRVPAGEIESLRGRKVIMVRGKVLRLIELGVLLEVPGRESGAEVKYVVIVGLAEQRVGILVDRLLGQEEVVIKRLGEAVGAAHGIAGATILGDGRVCLILDVGELLSMMDDGGSGARHAEEGKRELEAVGM